MTAQPQPGDFFVVRTGGWIAEQIRWFTSSTVNHAGIFVGPVVGLTGPQVIEARPGIFAKTTTSRRRGWRRGVGYAPAANYTNAEWSTGRLPADDTPTPAQRTTIVDAARKSLGTPYGFLDILAIALAQARTGGAIKATVSAALQPFWVRVLTSRRTMICSQLVDANYRDAGLHLFHDNRMPQLVAPSDLLNILAPA